MSTLYSQEVSEWEHPSVPFVFIQRFLSMNSWNRRGENPFYVMWCTQEYTMNRESNNEGNQKTTSNSTYVREKKKYNKKEDWVRTHYIEATQRHTWEKREKLIHLFPSCQYRNSLKAHDSRSPWVGLEFHKGFNYDFRENNIKFDISRQVLLLMLLRFQ